MAIRKGSIVKYIGDDPLMVGQTFRVRHKSYNHIIIGKPTRYLDGSIHSVECGVPIEDFVEVKRGS